MKKTLLSALLLTTVSLPAMAADMPVKAPVRIGAPVASDWSGFYILGSAGYSWGRISPDDFDLGKVSGDAFHNPKPVGGVFGFGGGYLWQTGRWVGGLEVDYSFSNEKDSQSLTVEDCFKLFGVRLHDPTFTLSSKIDALGSARIRAGYLLMDNMLVYGTAGLGFARSQATIAVSDTNENSLALTAKQNNFGWVAGGGVEVRIPGLDHVRLRGEYLHFDFGSVGYSFQPILTVNAKTTDDVARGALIWSFN